MVWLKGAVLSDSSSAEVSRAALISRVSSRCMEPMDAEQALRVRPNRPRLEQLTLTSSTPGWLYQSRHSSSAGLTCAGPCDSFNPTPEACCVLAFNMATNIVSLY